MRARGAKVTDIAVLVVAADDGLMPQTEEAIDHIKAADVPMIVAINKVDKADADPEKVKRQLAEHDLLVEDWGGDIISVPVSALNGEGVSDVLEHIGLVAEISELKANPDRNASERLIASRRSTRSHLRASSASVGDSGSCFRGSGVAMERSVRAARRRLR